MSGRSHGPSNRLVANRAGGFSELGHRTPPEVPISALSLRCMLYPVLLPSYVLRLIHAKKNREKRQENGFLPK